MVGNVTLADVVNALLRVLPPGLTASNIRIRNITRTSRRREAGSFIVDFDLVGLDPAGQSNITSALAAALAGSAFLDALKTINPALYGAASVQLLSAPATITPAPTTAPTTTATTRAPQDEPAVASVTAGNGAYSIVIFGATLLCIIATIGFGTRDFKQVKTITDAGSEPALAVPPTTSSSSAPAAAVVPPTVRHNTFMGPDTIASPDVTEHHDSLELPPTQAFEESPAYMHVQRAPSELLTDTKVETVQNWVHGQGPLSIPRRGQVAPGSTALPSVRGWHRNQPLTPLQASPTRLAVAPARTKDSQA